MSCLYPINGWYGKKNENGKRPVVFRRSDAYQATPYEKISVQVPCGKCEGCRADKAMSWAIRSYQEASLRDRNSFITLTYDDDHLPTDGKLVKEHLKSFLDELRKHDKSIKYYACGEYGSLTNRPPDRDWET